MKDVSINMAAIKKEIQWFSAFLQYRFASYFDQDSFREKPVLPDLSEDASSYAKMVSDYELTEAHRILLILVLIPHIKPQVLDIFYTKNSNFDRRFTEFGGMDLPTANCFQPTVETASFLLAEDAFADRHLLFELLSPVSPLIGEDIVRLGDLNESGRSSYFVQSLSLNDVYLRYFIYGIKAGPESLDVFPASRITTRMEWTDLILNEELETEIRQICTWVNGDNILKDLETVGKYIKPGFRCLFYGPPGTGKTLTATLIGKETNREVYRIDLSMIVSKYIGETEKNLSRVFDYAEKRDWILFFDEADALFGKRTQTNSSNDRFANQEVAYLLQRIEEFPGVVILASNLKSNIDEAFSRRFQSMIYFPMPDKAQRLRLWENMFAAEVSLEKEFDLHHISDQYELSGGSAINVFRFGLMKAMSRDSLEISGDDLIEGIRKEYLKYGRTL